MKNLLLLFVAIGCTTLYAQDFTSSPFQNFRLSNPVIADFNGDEKPDVLGIHYYNGLPDNMVLQLNNNAGTIGFTPQNLNLSFNMYTQPAASDMDSDGDMDVVISKLPDYNIFCLINDGTGLFTETPLNIAGTNDFQVIDADNDLDPDIVGLNLDNGTLQLYINDGNLNFTTTALVAAPSNLDVFRQVDIDADGDQDIVLGYRQFSGKQIVLLRNTGAANFEEVILVSDEIGSLEDMVVEDMNNDGKLDILAGGFFSCAIFQQQNNLLFSRINIPVSGIVISLNAADFNGDGRKDVLVGYNSSNLSWQKNLSNATFSFESREVGGVQPAASILPCDLDGDGDADIIVSNGDFWWYENTIAQEVATVDFEEADIQLYPNPCADVLYLKNTENASYQVTVINAQGHALLDVALNNAQVRLNDLPAGTYFIRLTNNKTQQNRSTVIFKK